MPRVREGDVVETRIRWGRLPHSQRDTCPSCRRFIKPGQRDCSHCGITFVPIIGNCVQVISVGA